jgi:hypothetical protein
MPLSTVLVSLSDKSNDFFHLLSTRQEVTTQKSTGPGLLSLRSAALMLDFLNARSWRGADSISQKLVKKTQIVYLTPAVKRWLGGP